VQFSTVKEELFSLIKVSIANLDITEFYFEENKIILKKSDVFFEINLVFNALQVVDYEGIILHDKNEILKSR
jgi:hypothetical protein